MGGDDEQEELRSRFEAEGLRSDELTDAKKLVTVWRWLVDSETNVSSLRNQLDKLHKQQNAEMKEVESYIEHIQSLFEEKVSRVQFDNRALRRQLDQQQQGRGSAGDERTAAAVTAAGGVEYAECLEQMEHIRRLLQQQQHGDYRQSPAQQLNSSSKPIPGSKPCPQQHLQQQQETQQQQAPNSHPTLADQVAFVLVERDRLKEQVERQRERELRLEENRRLYNNLPQSMRLSASLQMASSLDCSNASDHVESDGNSSDSSEGDYARIRSPPPRRYSRIDNAKRSSNHQPPRANGTGVASGSGGHSQQNATSGQSNTSDDSAKRNIRDPGNIKPMIADKQWIKNLLLQEGSAPPRTDGSATGAATSVDDINAANNNHTNNNNNNNNENGGNRLSRIDGLADRLIQMEKANRQLELDNETLAFKLSEALMQYDELEQRLRNANERRSAFIDKPAPGAVASTGGSRSQPESPVKQSFMRTLDNRWLSTQDAGLMEHCKKLHKEVISLQDQLYQTSQKLDALTVRYQDRKVRYHEKVQMLRVQHRADLAHLEETISSLRSELKTLHGENKNLLKSLLEREEGLVIRAAGEGAAIEPEVEDQLDGKAETRDIRSDVASSQLQPHQPTRL